MNKKKYLIYLIILILILCYGYISYRNQFFPYKIIKSFQQPLAPRSDLELKNLEEDKIRNKYTNWNKLNVNFKEVFIIGYYPGLNIFSNRHYFNHRNDEKLKGLYLIQIPRHYSKDIYLNAFNEIIIYRVLCKKNNNKRYINWEKENYKLEIIGSTCVHTDVIKKKYKENIIKIAAGGPISSDPIFIYDSKSGEQIFQ